MVRFHSNITPAGDDLMGIDQTDRDRLWKGLAAMKRRAFTSPTRPTGLALPA